MNIAKRSLKGHTSSVERFSKIFDKKAETLKLNITLWTIYSAPTFLEKCKKVVLEKWFCKLRFFFLVNHFSQTRFLVDLWYKTTFFSGQSLFLNQISPTRFLTPDFSTQISRTRFLRTAKIEGAE